MEFMHLVGLFTRMPGESYRRRLESLLLCMSDVFLNSVSLPHPCYRSSTKKIPVILPKVTWQSLTRTSCTLHKWLRIR